MRFFEHGCPGYYYITTLRFAIMQQIPTDLFLQILKSSGAQFETVNVLENPLIRQGIKEYTNWPTIPQVPVQESNCGKVSSDVFYLQVFIGGEFVGGCDIVTEMYQNGELKELVEKTMAE